MTAPGLHSRQMFDMTSKVVSREMKEANVYCGQLTRLYSYLIILRRDTDGVWYYQRRVLALNDADFVEWYDKLKFSPECECRLTSVTQPKMLAWKQIWFSDTYKRP